MSKSFLDLERDYVAHSRSLHKDGGAPLGAPLKAFDLIQAAGTDGALSHKQKELIALAIAVAKQCDGCIASHARGAARRGATVDEVAEALGVAIVMNGGPGTVYAPRAFAAFQEFATKP